VTCALRDIAAGEELTCDYRAFDAEAEAKLRH
jgi:SET domain-containing protein